jgi:hypothetical protein
MLKERERLFCEGIARGLSPSKAAKEAGYKGNSAGGKLMLREAVVQRIAELNEAVETLRASEVARAIVPTRDWVMRELIENVTESKAARDRSNVYRGLELVGRELGMFVMRTMEVSSPLQQMPAQRLRALLRLIDSALTPELTIEAEATTIEASDEAW